MALTQLEGKTALVTGGARGIGLAISRSFLNAGMSVIVTDQDADVLQDAVRELGPRAVAAPLDVTSPEQWERVVADAWRQKGGIDVLCNNAGMGVGVPAGRAPYRSWEVPLEKFHRVMDVNFLGTLLGMRTVLPRMIERGTPAHVVNTASMAGFLAPGFLSAYAASKFAVVALSEAAAAELQGQHVGISILCPGGVATAFNESARRFGADIPADQRPRGPATPDEKKMNPALVGERVVRAIRAGELYVFTHPEYKELVVERQAAVAAAFGESAQPGYRDPQDLLDRSRSPLHRRGQVRGSEA